MNLITDKLEPEEAQVKAFFRTLWPDQEDGFMAISTDSGNGNGFSTKFFPHPLKMDYLLRSIERRVPYNVWFTLGLIGKSPQHGRGKASDVVGIPGLVADIDCSEGVHNEKNLPTREEAPHFISELPFDPSMTIWSGGGFQVYWFFDAPWIFGTPEDREKASDLSLRWQRFIVAGGKEKGWKLDSVGSLEHLFRIPGTYNHKADPIQVEIIESNKLTYSVDSIQEFLEGIPQQQPQVEQRVGATIGSIDALPFPVRTLIKYGAEKGERSEAIGSVITAMVRAGVPEDKIISTFEAERIGEKYHEKGSNRVRWLQAEIERARNFVRTRNRNFFEGTTFFPESLVDHILTDVDVFHDGNQFYLYDPIKGVWKARHENVIGDMMRLAIGRNAKSSHIRDALKMLETRVFEEPEDLEPDLRIINLKNGMLEIESGELREHDKSYRSTVQIPIAFDPQARCPRFEQYLREVFPNDPRKSLTVQEFAGYCLYPKLFIHKCLFLIGSGANGKSLFINILIKVIGKENVAALELHQLSDKFLVGTLKDKLLNVSSEVQTKSQVQDNVFKQLISGDFIQADVKHKSPFTFRPIAKYIFSMNEIPVITDRTYALARRLIVVKFNQRFEGDGEDKRLEDKLTEELSGILNWCLEGLRRVVENDEIGETKQMELDKREFLKAINPVANFVDEACFMGAGHKIGKNKLYQGYVSYCKDSGLRPLSKIKFYNQFLSDYPQIVEKRPEAGERCFMGIKLVEPYCDTDNGSYY